MARKKKEITIEEAIEVVETKEEKNKQYKVIAPGGLRVREKSSLTSGIVEVLTFGTIVESFGEENDFVKVKNGYMLKEFLEEV